MQLELGELELRYASLRIIDRSHQRRLVASVLEHGQLTPVLVVRDTSTGVLLDGYVRVAALAEFARDLVDLADHSSRKLLRQLARIDVLLGQPSVLFHLAEPADIVKMVGAEAATTEQAREALLAFGRARRDQRIVRFEPHVGRLHEVPTNSPGLSGTPRPYEGRLRLGTPPTLSPIENPPPVVGLRWVG
jgi:hypothetical protein